jgi:hypothetical protein
MEKWLIWTFTILTCIGVLTYSQVLSINTVDAANPKNASHLQGKGWKVD